MKDLAWNKVWKLFDAVKSECGLLFICLIDKIWWCHDKVRWNIRLKYLYESVSQRSILLNVRTGCEICLEMVKTLVFAGLKFTFHKFDQLDRCANHELKPDGEEVYNEKRIIRLCHLRTMRLKIQWIQQYRWRILETIRDQGQSPVVPVICIAGVWKTITDSHYLAPITQVRW